MTGALRLLNGYRPHPAAVLGIDPASRSGWALFIRGELRCSGVARSAEERFEAIRNADNLSLSDNLPLIAILEDFSPGSWKSWVAIARAYEARGRWQEQLDLIGTPAVGVMVNDWRRALYGSRSMRKSMPRKMAKQMAVARVESVYRKRVSDDEAEAILIGEWGCRSAEVAAILET